MLKRRIYAVSNAHLDTQWNWTIQDTIRDCVKNTMDFNFRNIEGTKHYVMNFEGAFRYKLMREYYPEKYEQLKKYIKDGRWNVAGSFWDSCDVNIPSSEALMRQAILGNNFFEEEFGKRSYDIFLPDCFGFRSSVPSIASHMGIKGFSTQKLTWGVGCPVINEDGSVSKPMQGDFKRLDFGKWEGPDGNRIYVSLDEGGYGHQFRREGTPPDKDESLLDYTKFNEENSGYPWHSRYFGVGDYGGGCDLECAQVLDEAVDSKDGWYEVVAASTTQIFEDAEKVDGGKRLPVYKGMLNIPHGFGAYSSHAISKRWNRKNEQLADAAEKASVLAEIETGKPYPKERLKDAWKTFLWHQFHDDVTGTSICRAYVFSHNDYVVAFNTFAGELSASAEAVSSVLDTNVYGTPIIVYNPTGSKRTDVVKAEFKTRSAFVRVYNEDGDEVPSQIKDGVLTFVASVPAISFTVFDVREATSAYKSDTKAGKDFIENERYKVTVDKNGDVSSVYDKENEKELLSSPIRLEISESNSSNWPSWELGYNDLSKEHSFVNENVSVELLDNGGALVSLKITRYFGKSEFIQVVSLAEGSEIVRFDNRVNWYSTNSLLKATFPFTVSNPEAEFDLGLGADRQPNSTEYPYFQYNVHQWADLTDKDGSYGITVMNDCKYGMDKPNDNTLRLTLIHTPSHDFSSESMQSWQDMGRNEFAFAIAGHKNERNDMAMLAECFNSQLIPFSSEKHGGRKNQISALSKDNNDVLVRAFKKEYRGDRIILRLQEMLGKDGKVALSFGYDLDGAVETNGYEEYAGDVNYTKRRIVTKIGHYAPKTFALTILPKKDYSDPYKTVKLKYTNKITSCNCYRSNGDFNITIPCELFDKEFVSNSVPYSLGDKDKNNVVVCAGQTVVLPRGSKEAYILAASLNKDKTVLFNSKEYTVSDMFENVGSWDIVAAGSTCLIKRDDIAKVFTHTHEKDADRLYKFAYLFVYKVDLDDNRIVLPDDSDILVFAITASNKIHSSKALAPLYDVADRSNEKTYKLTTVIDGKKETRECEAGTRAVVHVGNLASNKIFDHFDGGNFVVERGTTAMLIKAPKDETVTAVIKDLGTNLALGMPCKASGEVCKEESASHAVNGDTDSKWCAEVPVDGCATLEVDLGKVTKVGKWYVVHCGACESPTWNTRDFELLYKENENDEWKVADKVEGNFENYTLRKIDSVSGRFFCLKVIRPTQRHRGGAARIYNFALFEN